MPSYTTIANPTTQTGPSGTQQVLPMLYTTGTPASISFEAGEMSTMDDYDGDTRGFKPCTHTTRKVKGMEPRLYHLKTYSWVRKDYGKDLVVPVSRWTTFGNEPIVSAVSKVNNLLSAGGSSFNASTYVGAIPGEPTNDRLGEIPARLYSAISDASNAISSFEARELPTLFRQLARRKSLFKNLDSLRALYSNPRISRRLLNIKAIKGSLGAAREEMLMVQFGLLPTVADAQRIAKELKEGRKQYRKSVTRALRDLWSLPMQTASYNDPTFGLQTNNTSKTLERVWGGCATVVKNYDDFGSYANLARGIDDFAGLNPAATLWAVAPWSFVIDWFTSLDNVIDNLFVNNSPNLEVLYWRSTKRQIEQRITSQYVTSRTGIKTGYYGQSAPTDDCFAASTATWECNREFSYYERAQAAPPSALDSVKLFGRVTPKTAFLTALLALGIRK